MNYVLSEDVKRLAGIPLSEAGRRDNPESITIKMKTDNASFEDENWESEVGAVLSKIADKISSGDRPNSVMDSNGNKIGTIEYRG